jgi:hypothetical protein
MVDGLSSYNNFDGNFALRIGGTGSRGSMDRGLAGEGFWFGNPNNYVTNNIVSDLLTTGVYGAGFEYYGIAGAGEIGEGFMTLPAYQGADPAQAGQGRSVDMNHLPLLDFENNEVYGVAPLGLSYWWVNFDPTNFPSPLASGGLIKNFVVWNVWDTGIYGYQNSNMTVDGFVDIGDAAEMAAGSGSVGMQFQDYFNGNLVVRNADIENQDIGITLPDHTTGTTTIRDSYLANRLDVNVTGLWWVSAGAEGIPPRNTVLDNVQFVVPLASPSFTAIAMTWFAPFQLEGGVVNAIQLDQVFVYNYDGVPGDNFQVFYTQQQASFVVPQSVFNSTGATVVLGAPVAGLTNEQTWAQYRVAIAGEVAPSNATTRANILGLVVPN